MPSCTIGTVLVASPNATGNTPEASGSRVPAWPAFFALKRYFNCATACVEVTPTGLSRLIQPLTSTRGERRGGDLRRFDGPRCGLGGRRVDFGLVAHLPSSSSSAQIARDARRLQQRVDFGLRGKAVVEREAQVRREFEIDALGDQRAQGLLVPVESDDRRLGVLAAERHDRDGRELQIGRHLHRRDRHHLPIEHGIDDFAALENFRHRVADRFADALETMRGAGVFGIGTRHLRESLKYGVAAPRRRREKWTSDFGGPTLRGAKSKREVSSTASAEPRARSSAGKPDPGARLGPSIRRPREAPREACRARVALVSSPSPGPPRLQACDGSPRRYSIR